MAKKDYTAAETLLDGLRNDILWLLSVVYAHRQRAALPRLSTMSRQDLVLEFLLLESTTRDIVSRVTALDDDLNNVRSFQTAFKQMKREGLDPKRTASLDKAVKAYRQTINALKVDHRNTYIGHVQDLADVTPRIIDAPVPFEEGVSHAVRLLDEMLQTTVTYTLRFGSQEAELDLRAVLSEPSHERA